MDRSVLLVAGEPHDVIRHEHVADVVAGGMAPPPDDTAGVARAHDHRTVTIRRRTLSSPIVFIFIPIG